MIKPNFRDVAEKTLNSFPKDADRELKIDLIEIALDEVYAAGFASGHVRGWQMEWDGYEQFKTKN